MKKYEELELKIVYFGNDVFTLIESQEADYEEDPYGNGKNWWEN